MKRFISVALMVFASMVGIFGVSSVAAQSAPSIIQQLQHIQQSLNSLQTDVNSLQKAVKHIPPSWSQKLPAAKRFELVLDGAAVLDKETGLVWEKAPSPDPFIWGAAYSVCMNLQLGDRMGWRLPTIEQLASLVDPSVSPPGPTLPTGHPFSNVQPDYYWSAKTYPLAPPVATPGAVSYAWDVNFRYGFVTIDLTDRTYHAWCVRGGETYEAW
jgi:hypothetical protein